MTRIFLSFLALLMMALPAMADARIKDISIIRGIRDNQLLGYGLVVGLQGTGDSLRNSPFTEQSLRSMLDRMGVSVQTSAPRTRNIAAVIVTAKLPPFIGKGSRIDVTVSSLGDATSLAGGTLVFTPLTAANGDIYAVAQGPIAVSGFSKQGQAESVTQGVPTAGRIANGALIERQIKANLDAKSAFMLELRNPDFDTVIQITDVVNAYFKQRHGQAVAREIDPRTVKLLRPNKMTAARFISEIGRLKVKPDSPAKVVIDERTGTIVLGQNVKISTVAVAHGNLTVRISEKPIAVQPEAFSDGETVVLPDSQVVAKEKDGRLAMLPGVDLETLVRGLNRIGLKPTGIIAILQAIKTAGALQAELVVQ